MTYVLPLRVVNTLNRREHWGPRSKRNAAHRAAVAMRLRLEPPPPLPVVVTLTRVAPKPFDSDGLWASLKAVRDAIAAHYGVDDGPTETRIQWHYAARRGEVRQYGVEIDVRSATE